MSKKVMKLAGRRPMLLALIVMATLILGLLFSGWLTPTRSKAQEGSGGGGSINENADCVASGTTTNCSEGSVGFTNLTLTVNPSLICIGSSVGASVANFNNAGQVIIDTSYTNANPNATNPTCSDSYSTNTPSSTIISNWWTASGCGINTNGSGLSTPSFTPTNCGNGTMTFYTKYQDICDTNQNTISTATNFAVDAVTNLTPSAGVNVLKVNDGDGDPNTDTYLVQSGCNNTITVTASDSLGLSPADLPDCWEVSPGLATFVDYKHFTIDGNTIGKTVISVNCGSSHKTITVIVYEAVYVINADQEDCGFDQHSWWDLTVQPSDVYQFLTRDDGTDISGDLGLCGYFGEDGSISCGDTGCPAHLEFGDQPITGTDPLEYYAASGSYWWCIRFTKLIGALTYVNDLDQDPGLYTITSNSCVTQAIDVGNAAGETILFSGYTACGFSGWLNDLRSLSPPVCYCQTGN